LPLTGTKREREATAEPEYVEKFGQERDALASGEWMASRLRILWNRRRFLMMALMFGSFLAALIAFSLPKRFESTARIMPPDSQSNSGTALFAALAAKTGAGLFGGDLLGMKSSGALFVGILGSATVQDRLIERFDMKKVYGVRLGETARTQLTENTILSEDRKSGIIAITVTDGSAQRAAAMGNAYTEELNRLVAELTTSSAHRERVFLEERLKTVKLDLDSAAKEFSEFSSKNVAIDIKEQGRAMVESAATLQGQLIAAQSELEGLKQIYSIGNVRVREVSARIQELQGQLDKMGGKPGTETSNSMREGDSFYPSIRKLPLLGLTYSDLYRRTKLQEAVYETLTQQFELAKVQEVKETPSVKILDIAKVPERKSFPPRLMIIFLGAFLTLTWGIAWVLGEARWEETDPQDPRKRLAQEVFAAMKAKVSWASLNGFGTLVRASKILGRLRLRTPPEERG
jgi:capsule polysaccharide export protein KpsE/RkpR